MKQCPNKKCPPATLYVTDKEVMCNWCQLRWPIEKYNQHGEFKKKIAKKMRSLTIKDCLVCQANKKEHQEGYHL